MNETTQDRVPVQAIEEIVIEVSDIGRAIAFYEGVVGLKLRSRGPQEAQHHGFDDQGAFRRRR